MHLVHYIDTPEYQILNEDFTFYFSISVYLFWDGERASGGEAEEERGGQRIQSGFPADGRDPDAGLQTCKP